MPAPETVSEAIDEFIAYQSAQVVLGNHSERTLIAYRQDLSHIRGVLGAIPLAALTQRTVDAYLMLLGEYISARTGKHLSPHTINKRLRSLRRLFNFCKRRGYLTSPPEIQLIAAEVDLDAKTIPLEDIRKILQYARTKRLNRQRDTFIIQALLDFGPRSAEVATMRLSAIDRERRLVTIRRKGGRFQTVPVSEHFIEALDDWLAVRPECDHDYVLCGTNNAGHPPISPAALGQAFRRMARRATGKSWGPHSVRHLWISEMLNRTSTPPKVVQDIAGHRSFRTTENYAKPDLEAQREAVNFDLLRDDDADQKEFNSGAVVTVYLN